MQPDCGRAETYGKLVSGIMDNDFETVQIRDSKQFVYMVVKITYLYQKNVMTSHQKLQWGFNSNRNIMSMLSLAFMNDSIDKCSIFMDRGHSSR